MGLLDDRGGKKYRVLYVASSGREYWLSLTSIGSQEYNVPFVIRELEDETFEADEQRYTNLDMFAVLHGCYLDGGLESVEPDVQN